LLNNIGSNSDAIDFFNKVDLATQKFIISSGKLNTIQLEAIKTTANWNVGTDGIRTTLQGLSEKELDAAIKTATLSAAQKEATTSTLALNTAAKGLWATMKAHPIMVATATIGAAIGLYTKWKQVQEDNRKVAQDAAKTYADTSKSIEEYAKKYEELHTALLAARGNEEETYNVKKQLLDLQTELNDKFGDEYGKLNLVTDAYRDQTDAIKAYNKEAANRFLNETPGLDVAEREMTKERDYFLGSTGNLKEQYAKDIYDVVSKYQDNGIQLNKFADKNISGYTIKFVGDATQANEVINELETEIRKLQKKYEDNSFVDNFIENSKNRLIENNKVIDAQGTQYEKKLKAEIASTDTLQKGFEKATQAASNYNETILKSGDPYSDENVLKAYENLQKIKGEIQNDDSWNKYSSILNEVWDSADTKILDLNAAIKSNEDGIGQFIDKIKGISEVDLSAKVDSQDAEVFGNLSKYADKYNISVDELVVGLTKLGYVQTLVSKDAPDIPPITKSDAITKVNELSEGLEALDKIMSSIKAKKEPFDYALLDDKNFKDNFKDLGDSYTDFIETISNSPKDIKACQGAFDNLLTAFLNHKGITSVLNEDTKSLVVSMLEMMGVTNAEAVATEYLTQKQANLAAEKYYNEQASAALEGATLNEVNRILDEADAAGIASSVIAQLALDKISVNDAQIDTASDIDQIINLANAAGSSALALSALANAKAVLGTDIGDPNSDKYDPQRVRTAMDTIDKLEAGTFDYGFQLDPDKFKSATYGGGTKTNKSGGSKDKSSKENSDIDWIDRRISLIKKKNSELESALSDTYTAYTGLTKEEINRVNELLASNISPASSEIDELIKLANKAGMSIGELQKAVQTSSGLESRQSILGELIANDKIIISEYQNSVDQYKQSYEELVAKVPEYRDKIENGGVDIELVSGDTKTQIQNAIDAFDKLNEAESNVDDSTRELRDHNKEYYKNISDSIESSNSKLIDSSNLIEKQIDLLSTSGHTISSSMYESLIENTEGQIRNAQKLLANKRAEMNELIGSGVSKDSEEYSNLRSEISDAEGSIIDLEKAQEEYNRKLLEMPVDNLDKIIGMHNDITEAMEKWRAEYEASGKKVDADYFQSLIHNGMETINQLKEQFNLIDDIMDEYDVGSEPWLDMYDRLKSCNSEMSSMVQNLQKWNEELLSMPLDSINEFSNSLNKVLTGLNSQKGEYDTVISAVTGAIKAQIDALNDEKKAFEDMINAEKDALQKKLDLLEKQNEKLKLQRNLEHALYNLQVANTQKTEQVKLLPEHTVMYGRFKYA